jgi:hypothetical protein
MVCASASQLLLLLSLLLRMWRRLAGGRVLC